MESCKNSPDSSRGAVDFMFSWEEEQKMNSHLQLSTGSFSWKSSQIHPDTTPTGFPYHNLNFSLFFFFIITSISAHILHTLEHTFLSHLPSPFTCFVFVLKWGVFRHQQWDWSSGSNRWPELFSSSGDLLQKMLAEQPQAIVPFCLPWWGTVPTPQTK